jgi:hypothetical protein
VRTFEIALSDELGITLEDLAHQNKLTPRQFGTQLLESSLASYRLPGVTPSTHAPTARTEIRSLYQSRSIECRGGG